MLWIIVLRTYEFLSFRLMGFVFCYNAVYKLVASKLNKMQKSPFGILLFVPTFWSTRFPIFLKILHGKMELYSLYKC
jgi:hypothetical protein